MAGPLSIRIPAEAAECTIRIGAEHPAFPGHFPGTPVVPGVLLLDRIVEACENWLGVALRIDAMPQVKFLAPLLPDETATAVLQRESDDSVAFRLLRGGQLLASGILKISVAQA